MRKLTLVVALGCLGAAVWHLGGAKWLLASGLSLFALYLIYTRSKAVRTRVSKGRERVRAEIKEPHPLSIVGVSLLGTILIVNFSTIWHAASEALDEPARSELALVEQLDWLEEAVGSESFYIPDGPQSTFKGDYQRFDFDRLHHRREPRPAVGIDEFLERKFELMDREVTVTGDLVSVVDFHNGQVGLWIWDTDEQRSAEASCAVKVEDPDAFIEGQRVRIEALSLLYATSGAGTDDSRPIVGFACARAEPHPYAEWSPEERVDEYIDALQRSDGWLTTLDQSRSHWINHYDQFRPDRVHPYSWEGLKQAPVRRLIWSQASFDGRPVVTWGWVTSTANRPETINGKPYVRQQVTVQDDDDPSSEALCDVLRPSQRRLHEDDWVNAIGIVLGTETVPSSGGGFSNMARMVCSTVVQVGS